MPIVAGITTNRKGSKMLDNLNIAPAPYAATGWNDTIINDADGNTICAMPAAHLGLEAVRSTARMMAAAPELFRMLRTALDILDTEPTCNIYKAHKAEMRKVLEAAQYGTSTVRAMAS